MRHALAAVLFAIAVVALAAIIRNDFYLRIMFSIGCYFLCAVGMNVLLGFAGQKSLGQAGLFAAGAYTVALLTTRYEVDPWVALALAAIVSGVFGVAIALPSLRVRGPYLAMVTLAFGIVVEKLVSESADFFGGVQGIYGIKPLSIGGDPFTLTHWVWFVVALGLIAHLLLRNMLQGRFGRAFISLQADEIAAQSVGVSVYRYKVLAFVVAAVTCGIAGALVAQQNQYFNSDFVNFNLSIFIMLLVLFGGGGSIYGPLLGAIILTSLGAFLARWSWIEHFVNGALLLFALYAMPQGIAGMIGSALRRIGIRATGPAATIASSDDSATVAAASPRRKRAAPAGVLLRAEGLWKSYGGVRPAQDVSFSLPVGHIHALIGPNGAGKSTLINILTGVVRPDRGRVQFLNHDITTAKTHEICAFGIARTFQNLRLFKDISVLDNVLLGQHSRLRNGLFSSMFALPLARHEESSGKSRALAILSFVGLGHVIAAPAGSLPYGLQRRVELARAIASEPSLLLLDEPAAGLNSSETAALADLLLKVRDLGIGILLVEHHMDLVMKISDHVIVLDNGVKIAEGTPQQVQDDPKVNEAYLGVPASQLLLDDEPALPAPTAHDTVALAR